MIPTCLLVIALCAASAVAGKVVSVEPLLQPFFPFPDAPDAPTPSVFVEEFGPTGPVIAYEGICLAYTHVAPGLTMSDPELALLFYAGTFNLSTMRNELTYIPQNSSVFALPLLVPPATSNLGRAFFETLNPFFGWTAATGYPNPGVVSVLADQDAIAAALLASTSPSIGVISYLKALDAGLPCMGLRHPAYDYLAEFPALGTLDVWFYTPFQDTGKVSSGGWASIGYPLIGAVTTRIVRNGTCNTDAENLVADTLRTGTQLLMQTTHTGIFTLGETDMVNAYMQFLAHSCIVVDKVPIAGPPVSNLAVGLLNAARNAPGFYGGYTSLPSGAATVQAVSSGTQLIGATEGVTVAEAAQSVTLGNTTVQMIPWALTGCPIVYSIPAGPKINLPRCALPAIMRGEITMWNDPLIQEVNPFVSMAAHPIVRVTREDDTDINLCVQAALAEIERSCGLNVTFQRNRTWGATHSNPVTDRIAMVTMMGFTPFSIGYMSLTDQQNYFVMFIPSLVDPATAAVDSYDTMSIADVAVDPVTMQASYRMPAFPFVTTTYLIVPVDRQDNCSQMTAAVTLLEWMLTDSAARGVVPKAGLFNFPQSVLRTGLARLKATMRCGGSFMFAQPASSLNTMAIVGGAVGAPMGIVLVLLIAFAIHLAQERKRRQQQIVRSIELTTDIAGALCDYDLEYVDLLLDEYCMNEHHNTELVKPFRSLRGNLGEYRPYIPRYLLPDGCDDDTKSKLSGSGLSVSSGRSIRSSKSIKSAVDVAYASKPTAHAVNGQVSRKICIAVIDLSGSTRSSSGKESKMTTKEKMDAAAVAVHAALGATHGVLHCFIGDSVVASWNSAKDMQQPEKKACRFLCLLQKDASIKDLRLSGVVVSGQAYCHPGGDATQRTLVVATPPLFARLEKARALAQQSGSLVIDATVRSCVNVDFLTMPYAVQRGDAYYEILRDNSEDDGKDEEWMYRVAKAENSADAQLEKVVQHWLAGRTDEAARELAAVSTKEEAISSRIPALASRMKAPQ